MVSGFGNDGSMRHLALRLQSGMARAIKKIGYHTPGQRLLFHQYDYMFSPGQLGFLCECLLGTNELSGPVVEIGCAGGSTTVYLNKYLDEIGSSRRYICVDTFSGFTSADIDVERERGKIAPYELVFKAYSKPYMLRTLQNNGVTRPEVYEADVNDFDFALLGRPSMCLVDVDLFRPVKHSLESLLPRMAPGGLIVVDDCEPDSDYDGALQAYLESTTAHGIEPDVRHGKLGVIEVSGAL